MATGLKQSHKQVSSNLGPGVSTFFRWWWRELSWLIPGALRETGLPSGRLLWVSVVSDTAVFHRITQGKPVEVGRLKLASEDPALEKIAFDKLQAALGEFPAGIAVKSGQVLRKRISLPLAARDNLEQVVRFEMDRQTPYRVDQTFYSCREAGLRENAIDVDLTVLPSHVVAPALRRIKLWGLDLHGIAILDELTGRRGYVNLLPSQDRPATGRLWPWVYAAMGTLTVALIATLLAIPLWQKREMVMSLQAQSGKWNREAIAVAGLKDNLTAVLAGHNHLIAKRLTTPPTVAILNEVSSLLPDNTWVHSLEVRGKEVLIQGETGASSRLAGLFENSKLLGEANHKSPLVKVQNNLERFQLAVALRAIPLETASAGLRAMQARSVDSSPAGGRVYPSVKGVP